MQLNNNKIINITKKKNKTRILIYISATERNINAIKKYKNNIENIIRRLKRMKNDNFKLHTRY